MLQETTSKFDFTRRGEHAQEFSYTQGAARRTELRRLQAYVKMSDYMVCDALQEVRSCRQLQACCPAAAHNWRTDCTATVQLPKWAMAAHISFTVQCSCDSCRLWSSPVIPEDIAHLISQRAVVVPSLPFRC